MTIVDKLRIVAWDVDKYPIPYPHYSDLGQIGSYLFIPKNTNVLFSIFRDEISLLNKSFYDYVERDHAMIYSIHHENYYLFYIYSSSPSFQKVLREHYYRAVDYYSTLGDAGFNYLFVCLNQLPYDDVLADILDRLEPKLPKDKPDIVQQFHNLRETIRTD